MSEERDAREQWAEVEASQFDKISAAIRKSAEQWRTMSPSAETMNMAQICLLKADTWAEAARSLRQPYRVRIERQEQSLMADEMTPTDHAELARLAEAATAGEWRAADWDAHDGENLWTVEAREPEVLSPGQSSIWPDGVRCKRVAQTEEGENPTEDAAFIAAANPARVLALLAEIAALRGDLAKTERDYSELRDSYDAVVAKLTIERAHGTKQSIRATQAERQRDEAVGLVGLIVGDAFGCNEDSCLVSHRIISDARNFLASMEPKT